MNTPPAASMADRCAMVPASLRMPELRATLYEVPAETATSWLELVNIGAPCGDLCPACAVTLAYLVGHSPFSNLAEMSLEATRETRTAGRAKLGELAERIDRTAWVLLDCGMPDVYSGRDIGRNWNDYSRALFDARVFDIAKRYDLLLELEHPRRRDLGFTSYAARYLKRDARERAAARFRLYGPAGERFYDQSVRPGAWNWEPHELCHAGCCALVKPLATKSASQTYTLSGALSHQAWLAGNRLREHCADRKHWAALFNC